MSRKIVNCPHCGRMLPGEFWKETSSTIPKTIKCPNCGSQKLWRDGKRQAPLGEMQRYLCRDCGHRFSQW